MRHLHRARGRPPDQRCLTLVVQCEGRSVTTVEGLAGADGELHPVQQAFADHDAFQCGYCTRVSLCRRSPARRGARRGRRRASASRSTGDVSRCCGVSGYLAAVLEVARGGGPPVQAFAYARAGTAVVGRVAADPRTRSIAGGTELLNWLGSASPRRTVLVDVAAWREVDGRCRPGRRVRHRRTRRRWTRWRAPARRSAPRARGAACSRPRPRSANRATIGGNLLQRTRCPSSAPTAPSVAVQQAPSGQRLAGSLARSARTPRLSSAKRSSVAVQHSDPGGCPGHAGHATRSVLPTAGARTIPMRTCT